MRLAAVVVPVSPGRHAVERVEEIARPEFVDAVHEALARLLASAQAVDVRGAMSFELAVVEVAGNSVRHARPAAGGAPVRLTLELEAGDGALKACLREHGTRPAPLRGPCSPMPDRQAESGRGLVIAARLLSSLSLERAHGANVWNLTLGAPPTGSATAESPRRGYRT